MDVGDHDLPAGIGRPAFRAFTAAGYTRLEQFAGVSEAELLKLHGVGPRAIRILRSALEVRGLTFADPGSSAARRSAEHGFQGTGRISR